jgi:ribonuclease BN (tRNA processing enzyme)
VVVTGDGHEPIVFDAGTGLPNWGSRVPADRPFGATLLLTHLHLDHIQGLRFFTPLLHADARLDLYGPPQDGTTLEAALTRLLQPPFHPLQLSDKEAQLRCHEMSDSPVTIGSATVLARSVPHLGPTLGYRVEAGGVSVAYISDHQAPADLQAMDDGVLELAAGVDLLIHDAQYTPVEWETKSTWGHSTVAYGALVAHRAGAKALALFHHDPWRSDDDIDVLVGDAQRAAAGMGACHVMAASEGLVVDLG